MMKNHNRITVSLKSKTHVSQISERTTCIKKGLLALSLFESTLIEYFLPYECRSPIDYCHY